MNGDESNQEDDLRELLRKLMSGEGDIDPSRLAAAAGLPSDPAALQAMLGQLQQAMSRAGDSIDWAASLHAAEAIAGSSQRQLADDESVRLHQAFTVAALWLDEVVDVTALAAPPELMTRRSWVVATMPVWSELAEPVAVSIADALTSVLSEHAPEEMRSMLEQASKMLRGVGGALFAMQFGQAIGRLSSEVIAGGDIGIPLISDGRAVLLPQNFESLSTDLDVPLDEVALYLAVRELAHARLFRHARWLRLHFISAIKAFASGIRIDTDRMESLAENFDPADTEALKQAVSTGELIRPRTPEQEAALARIETMLALVEGWVDAVTAAATSRLPHAAALAEAIRRRRATGGPAESALSSLVGLELRPRRLRDAAALWTAVGDAVGVAARDALWAHPDLVPTGEDLDAPAALIAHLTGTSTPDASADDFDRQLQEWLDGPAPGAAGTEPGADATD